MCVLLFFWNIPVNSRSIILFLSLSLSLPLEYKEKHGDCNVPQKYPDNPPLGRWVDNQKTQHKKLYDGKSTHLTIERIQHLVSVGFDFRPNKKEKNKD